MSTAPAPAAAGQISASGAAVCTDCSAGFVAPNEGSALCTACSSGAYAPTLGATYCTACPAGSAQGATGQGGCSPCSAGRFAANASSAGCSDCASGAYSAAEGSTACSACLVGQFQGATGQTECQPCEAGKFAPTKGLSSCSDCPGETSSTDGAASCKHCVKNFYRTDDTCSACPENAVCEGGRLLPAPRKGYWSYWSDMGNDGAGGDIFPCLRATCKGSVDGSNKVEHKECWAAENASQFCDYDSILCEPGSHGPLCGTFARWRCAISCCAVCARCTLLHTRSCFANNHRPL